MTGAGAGSLELTARRSGARTVLERVRYDGISRCSRAFTAADSALIVLSQLGPGVVRGDDVTVAGRLRPESRLIVTNQTATRLMGGSLRARSNASWLLETGAFLDIVGEPLIASANATYTGTTTIELGDRACVMLSEIACVPSGADVRLRTSLRSGGRELYYDAVDAAWTAPATVGTFVVVGLDADILPATLDACDAAADAAADVKAGVGALPGGVMARVTAREPWAVRTALATFRAAARRRIASRNCADPARRAGAH